MTGAERARLFREKHGERVNRERRQVRILRLVEQMTAAGATWAEAEYEAGLEDGRGTPSARSERTRVTAEARFRDSAAKVAAAVTPPVAGKPPQRRLRRAWRGK